MLVDEGGARVKGLVGAKGLEVVISAFDSNKDSRLTRFFFIIMPLRMSMAS